MAQFLSPNPLNDIRRHMPKAVKGLIEGEEVFILMSKQKGGKPDHWDRFIADPSFMTLLRVYDSGNKEAFDMLAGEGFRVTLLAPNNPTMKME